MANSVRDANQVTARLGSSNGTPTRLVVEHATGYLKAVITGASLAAPSVDITRDIHDDNGVPSSLGWDGTDPKPLLVENSTGYLRAVIV